jgi:hypothetical protein
MNSAGTAFITGKDGTSGYYAFVSPSGALSSSTVALSSNDPLYGSINNSGSAIIGSQSGTSNGYVAQVAPDGTVTPVSLENVRVIDSVALNDEGVGLVGGEGSTAIAYASFVSADGTATPVSNIPVDSIGRIYSVDINESGKGVIGGFADNDSYAAFVTSEGATTLSPLPESTHFMRGVAINASGVGLIAGHSVGGSPDVYAGSVAADGTVTPLFDSPFEGELYSADLNNTGTGIIGGRQESNLYAAFVGADGTVTPIFSTSTAGQINAVAISESGVGLLGGAAGSDAYAALVAPNGAITALNVSGGSSLASVAIIPGGLDGAVTPTSVSFAASTPHVQLAATSALETRFIDNNVVWQSAQNGSVAMREDELLVYTSHAGALPPGAFPDGTSNAVWLEPFGNLFYVDADGSLPRFRNYVVGGLLGYDHRADTYMVGAAAGYGFNRILLSNDLGDGHLHEGLASLYGAYYSDHFWIGAAAWIGGYYLYNTRRTLGSIESTGKTHGWVASPHIEFASPWAFEGSQRSFFEPFIAFDWVGNWQNAYTETGPSGLNVEMPHVRNSLLQIEAGLRFYQLFGMNWGSIRLEEKVSYINQNPSNTTSVSTSFVGASSTFPVAVSSARVQNLASGRVSATFIPNRANLPYGGGSVEATVNSRYQSYFFSLFIGYEF